MGATRSNTALSTLTIFIVVHLIWATANAATTAHTTTDTSSDASTKPRGVLGEDIQTRRTTAHASGHTSCIVGWSDPA